MFREQYIKVLSKISLLTFLFFFSSCNFKTWECEGDCQNGKGTKKWSDGGIQKGSWKNGKQEGEGYQYLGESTDFSGDTYEGEFHEGKYHGYGVYTDVSEDAIYKGYWKNGKMHGKGKLTFGDQSQYLEGYYDGDWKNGKRHGYGIRMYTDPEEFTNNRYEGEWQNDNKHGHGKYFWPDEGTYIGPWKDDEQHGRGIYIFKNGDTLKGIWHNGYCEELANILYPD